MLQSLRYATAQAQRSNSQREGATIKNSRRLDRIINYAIQNTKGDTSQLITDINNALFELRANEIGEYKLFQLIIQNGVEGVRATLRKPLDEPGFTNFLEVQLKPENGSDYEGNLLEYLRDALYSVLVEYRTHCPKPSEDTQVQAVFA